MKLVALGRSLGLVMLTVLAMGQPGINGQVSSISAATHRETTASKTAAYPQRSFVIKDQVSPESSFAQFRQRLLLAIRDRPLLQEVPH